jgi:hypothetical protein
MPNVSWEREDNASGLEAASGTPPMAGAFQKMGAHSGKIYLTVVYNGTIYVGCLSLNDHKFCKQSFEYLRRCYGMAIMRLVGRRLLP